MFIRNCLIGLKEYVRNRMLSRREQRCKRHRWNEKHIQLGIEYLELRLLLSGEGFGFSEDVAGQFLTERRFSQSLTAADFDGDGDRDVAVVASGEGSVILMRNQGVGSGAFSVIGSYPTVGINSRFIASADFDSDGDVDLVTANRGSNSVSVLMNQGNGTFSAAVTYNVGRSPESVAVADVDLNGSIDLITTNSADRTVSVLQNTGSGTFTSHVDYGVGASPRSVAIADFDSDGVVDLVVANASDIFVSFLRNQGAGTFAEQVTIPAPGGAQAIAAVDADGDGRVDFATSSTLNNEISVFQSLGNGLFQSATIFPISASPDAILATDFDLNGTIDLVATHYDSNSITVVRNQGNGVYAERRSYAVGVDPASIIAADVNGDSIADLITVNDGSTQSSGSISVVMNPGNGTLIAPVVTSPVGQFPGSLISADFNKDGLVDLAFGNSLGESIAWVENLGSGQFGPALDYGVFGDPTGLVAADFDNDGDQDLATSNFNTESVNVLQNLGDGAFESRVIYAAGNGTRSITAADVNEDGFIDLIAVDQSDAQISVLRNLGDGTFDERMTYPVGMNPFSITAADFDGDGDIDLATASNLTDGTVSVLLNQENGSFSAATSYSVGQLPQAIISADFNKDGAIDLAVANSRSGTVSVLLNNGTGTFVNQVVYPTGSGLNGLKYGDFDGDGWVDLVTTNFTLQLSTVAILRNNGDGTFEFPRPFGTGTSPTAIVAANLNQDDRLDLATTNSANLGTLSVLINQGPAPTALPDLNVSAITLQPTELQLGSTLTVEYTVRNQGTSATTGSWFDSIYLSRDNLIDGSDVLLGRRTHNGNLEVNVTYTDRATYSIGAFDELPSDEWFTLVRTDSAADLSELDDQNNLATTPLSITRQIGTLEIGQVIPGQLAAGQAVYYQLKIPAGQSISLALEGLPSDGEIEIYLQRGTLPNLEDFEQRGAEPFSTSQYLFISEQSQPTTYFVMVVARTLARSVADYTLSANVASFGVRTQQFGTAGNQGNYTLRAVGAGFHPNVVVRLTNDLGFNLAAASTILQSANEYYATFDLRGVEPGLYDVEFSNTDGQVVTLPQSLTVTLPIVQLGLEILAPTRIRRGREYTFSIEWINQSLNDIPAPLLTIGNTVPFGMESSQYNLGTQYTFLGTNTQGGSAGILRPGQREVRTFWAFSDNVAGDYFVSAGQLLPDVDEPFEWSTIQGRMKPLGMTDAAFQPIFDRVIVEVGSTNQDYLAMLSRNASLIPNGWGSPQNLDDLLALEVLFAQAKLTNSISGRVSTADARVQIAGRQVFAYNQNTGEVFTSYTLQDGHFVLSGLSNGSYLLEFEGLHSESQPPVDVNSSQVVGVQISLQRGSVIQGKITSQETGLAISDARITIRRLSGELFGETSTDYNGNYTFAAASAGDYSIEVVAQEHSLTKSTVTVTGEDLNFNAALANEGRIFLKIEKEPGDTTETRVVAKAIDGPFTGKLFLSQFAGNQFQIEQLPAGLYDLQIQNAGYQVVEQTGIVVGPGSRIDLGTSTLARAGTITGTVRTTDPEQLIPGLVVSAYSGQVLVGSGNVTAAGTYEIDGLPFGTYTVQLEGIPFATTSVAALSDSVRSVVVDLRISAGGVIEGFVTNAENTAVASVPVILTQPGTEPLLTVSDSTGFYRFTELGLGNYHVSVGAGLTESAGNASIENLFGTPVNLPLKFTASSALTGTVLNPDGTPITGATVLLVSSRHVVATSHTNALGVYLFDIVRPGSYDLRVANEDASFAPVIGIEVSLSTTQQVNFTAGASSVVINTTAPGVTSAGTIVQLYQHLDGSSELIAEQLVSDNPEVSFTRLTAGNYLIRASTPTGQQAVTQVSVGNGEVRTIGLSYPALNEIKGFVTHDGVGVPSTVMLIRRDNTSLTQQVITDDSGLFQFSTVPSGTYDVVTISDGLQTDVRTAVTIGGNTELAIPLSTATSWLSGVTQDESGSLLENVTVSVFDSEDRFLGTTDTDSAGAFVIAVPAGHSLRILMSSPFALPVITTVETVAGNNSLGNFVLNFAAVGRMDPEPDFAADAVVPASSDVRAEEFLPIEFRSFETAAAGVPTWLQQILTDEERDPRDVGPDDFPEIPPDCDCESEIDRLQKSMVAQEMAWGKMKASEEVLDAQFDLTALFWIRTSALTTAALLSAAVAARNLYYASRGVALISPSLGGKLTLLAASVLDPIVGARADLFSALSATDPRAASASLLATLNNVTKVQKAINAKNDILFQMTAQNNATPPMVFRVASNAVSLLNSVLFFIGNGFTDAINKMHAEALEYARQLETFETDRRAYKEKAGLARYALNNLNDCIERCKRDDDEDDEGDEKRKRIDRPASIDPNDITGPAAYGPESHLAPHNLMPYLIRFENDPKLATAPAASVVITQTLDSDLDWASFRLGDIGFGHVIIDVPDDVAFFQTRYDLTASRGIYVDIKAGIDSATGQVRWELSAIDPVTNDLPEDPLIGFLPPNVTGPEGEGFVNYTVRTKSTVVTGDRVDAVASIVFDVNDPIVTPSIFHTIDRGAPTTAMLLLPPTTNNPQFVISWSGNDEPQGSGIASWDIYMSVNNGPFELFLEKTTETSAIFTGNYTQTYAFYSVATDNVGHTEVAPTTPDTTITVEQGTSITLDPTPLTYPLTLKSAAAIDANAEVVTSSESNSFAGTRLVVTISANHGKKDRLGIGSKRNSQVVVKKQKILVGSVVVGTIIGGKKKGPTLNVDFGPTATLTLVETVLRNVTFATKKTPGTRTIEMRMENLPGGSLSMATREIIITN